MSAKAARDFKSIPDEKTILAAGELEVFDANGKKVKFGSLFQHQKTVVVFIRHFFCGVCQGFVEQLAAVSKADLDQANTRIVILGCGEYGPIKKYAEDTNFTGDIYADPTVQVYHALGMDVKNLKGTPAGEERRSYVPSSGLLTALQSTWRGLKQPQHVGKQGSITQLGGDFIFGPGNTCSFAWRMQHTEDHVEVSYLMKEAGVISP